MYSDEKINLIRRIDSFIRRQYQGNAIDLSRRLGVSKRTFYRCLDFMKHVLNAPVKFDSRAKRYFYSKNGKVIIGFYEMESLKKEDEKGINGGCLKNIFRVSISDTLLPYTC